MITRLVFDLTGKHISTIFGSLEQVALNTPANVSAIDVDAVPNYPVYLSNGDIVKMPDSPNIDYIFDYVSEAWIDPRSLNDVKQSHWSKLKIERDMLEFGGFEFEGNTYDSDQVSQGRIMGAALGGIDQVWTLADNTTVELSVMQLQQLYAALQAHIASVHERGRIARQLIYEAETKDEVEAIHL